MSGAASYHNFGRALSTRNTDALLIPSFFATS
jgi:hypothetical protein